MKAGCLPKKIKNKKILVAVNYVLQSMRAIFFWYFAPSHNTRGQEDVCYMYEYVCDRQIGRDEIVFNHGG